MSVPLTAVDAPDAPTALGPYRHAVAVGGLLFCSGQLPADPATGELVSSAAAAQAEQCLRNLSAVCRAGGTSMERAVRITIFMTDLSEFDAVNEVCGRWFTAHRPARATIGVKSLPRGARVEIDAIVALP